MTFKFFARTILILLLLNSVTIVAQNVPIGSWRTHLQHNDAYKVAEYNGKLYFITTSLVSYDPSDGNIKVLSKAEGFSDSEPVLIETSLQNNLLMIVYKNGNIDLLKDNSIINLSDIKRQSSNLKKRVNQIYFYGSYAYLACSFGIVVLDLKSMLFIETYSNLGAGGDNVDVKSMVIKDDSIYIATTNGLYSANINAPNLHDYLSWKRLTVEMMNPDVSVRKILNYNDTLYISTDTLFFTYSGGIWKKLPFTGTHEEFRASGDELIILFKKGNLDAYSNTNFVLFWKSSKQYEILKKFELSFIGDCIYGTQGNYWVATGAFGLIKLDKNKKILENYIPNGTASTNYVNMNSWEDELHVNYNDYLSVFKNGFWSNYRFKKKVTLPSAWELVDGIKYVSPDYIRFKDQRITLKTDDGKVYVGSYVQGLLIKDENGLISTYSDTNSIFKTSANQTLVVDIKADSRNNIWFINDGTISPIVVKTSDNAWYSFKIDVGIEILHLKKMIIDQQGYIWGAVDKEAEGLVVFNHNNTFDDITDDEWKLITSFSGEGRSVGSLAVDIDNRIWIGTEDGITVFYSPENIFNTQETNSNCPVFEQRCLLSGQMINCIVVDSNNRKWIGTRSGAYLFNEDGTEQIYHFNVDNSPLISNTVNQISIVTTSGEVFFNTDKGISSYRSTATKSFNEKGFLNVFPNPVLPGYEGLIAISGLPFRATVKITDIAGKLAYETQAEGGTAIWNGKDSNQKKVQTGVYLIFISKEDGTELQVTKIAFIN